MLTPPVDAQPIRAFHYEAPFAARQHRGVDFATRPGDPVRAPCSGRITFAGRLPSGEAVTLRCPPYSVTLLGVDAARAGAATRAGEALGRTTGRELHLGVRRAGDRFGYVDPAPLLRRARRPPAGPPPAVAPPRAPARRRTPPAAAPAPASVPSLAPWPVWLGCGLLLLTAAGLRLRRADSVTPCPDRSTSRSSRPTSRLRPASSSRRSAGG